MLLPLRSVLAQSAPYTQSEVVVLDGFDGYGDPGTYDTSETIKAPDSHLGFSVKFQFNADTGAPVNWWSLHTYLPSSVEGYDTADFEIYKESADPNAGLALSLAEADDNRFKLWDHSLSDIPTGQWVHITVKRPDMALWQISTRPFDWNDIVRFTIEPRAGKSVFYLDNVRLTGPGKPPMYLISTADDGMPAYNGAPQPLQPAVPKGAALFPFDLFAASSDINHDTQVGIRKTLQMPIATPMAHYGLVFVKVAAGLRSLGITTPYYTQFGNGYTKFLTNRQAWGMNELGHSLNTMPITQVQGWDFEHTIDQASAGVDAATHDRIDTLIKAGVTTWMVPDYCIPYYEGQWGYSQPLQQAYRKDLAGTGEPLEVSDGKGGDQPLTFPQYFKEYNGFYPTPQALGLTEWSQFAAPLENETGTFANARKIMFMHLKAFEWLKMPSRAGSYYMSRGGQGLWIIPNGESTYVTPDYVYLLRSRGIGSLMPEWFGNGGLLAESAYAAAPYLREVANQSGNRLTINVETGCTGHSNPYWDWHVAYDAVYAIEGASKSDNFDDDFIDESTYQVMSNPSNAAQFARFRDAMTKATAFRQAYEEKASVPARPILCITDRPVGREAYGIFDRLTSEYSPGLSLSRAHLPFDLRDSLDMAGVIDRYNVIFYAPKVPRVGDIALLRRWVAASADHILVTHTFVPTRDASGFWHLDHSVQTGSADGAGLLGLGTISNGASTSFTVTTAKGAWAKFFAAGASSNLSTPLTTCTAGDTIVDSDQGPLVTRTRVGSGQIIYLHFTSDDPHDPAALALNIEVDCAVAAMDGIAPLCSAPNSTSVQVFNVPGGKSVVAWDTPTLDRWNFQYVQGLAPLVYAAPGVASTIHLPVAGDAKELIYDLWANTLSSQQPANGMVDLPLTDVVTCLYYVGPDTPAFRSTISAIQATRSRLTADKFESIP